MAATDKTKEETKAAKFRRLGTARTNKAVKAINALSSLSNKNAYDRTDEQAKTIVAALKNAVKNVENAFAGETVESDGVSL